MSRQRDALLTLVEAIRYVFPDPRGTFSDQAVEIAEQALRRCEHHFLGPGQPCSRGCGMKSHEVDREREEYENEKMAAPLWEIARGVHRLAQVLENRLPIAPVHNGHGHATGWQEIGSPIWLVHQRMSAYRDGRDAAKKDSAQ